MNAMKTAWLFPGQGAQYIGMGKDLYDVFPEAKAVFDEANVFFNGDIRKICFDGPEEELRLTANTQPCILTYSVAVWRVLKEETDLMPEYYAGHSLGEYSAVVAAGKLELARAAYLVRSRGESMQAAVPPGVGAMAAVMNVSADDLITRCAASSSVKSKAEVVNFNSPQQLVIAGHKEAVDAVCGQLETDGHRFVMLPVSAPFHSSLMAPAREAMEPLLKESTFKAGSTKIVANLTGKYEPEYGADHLIAQINSPVLWTQSIEFSHQAGCEHYVEIGPGKVLFGLARRILPRGPKLAHTENLKATIDELLAVKKQPAE